MKSAAAVIISDVRENTLAGHDSSGAEFKPYTSQYAARRRAKNLPTDKVDLKVTGGLLDSLTYDAAGFIVSVDAPHEPIAEGLMQKRDFLGEPNDTTIQRIEEKVALAIERS